MATLDCILEAADKAGNHFERFSLQKYIFVLILKIDLS